MKIARLCHAVVTKSPQNLPDLTVYFLLMLIFTMGQHRGSVHQSYSGTQAEGALSYYLLPCLAVRRRDSDCRKLPLKMACQSIIKTCSLRST